VVGQRVDALTPPVRVARHLDQQVADVVVRGLDSTIEVALALPGVSEAGVLTHLRRHVAPWRGANGAVQGAIVRVQPVAHEAALPEAARLLSLVSDGYFVVDRQWCFRHVNPAAEALLARPAHSLLG
jgi:PAS domain-containing protein